MISVAAVMFEGGPDPTDELEQTVCGLRGAVALDTLERLQTAPGIDQAILVTNRPNLAAGARLLGVRVLPSDQDSFDFGVTLRRVVDDLGAGAVIYLSGAAAPLLPAAHWEWMADRLRQAQPCVVMNNPQSADVVGWSPAAALTGLPGIAGDNALGYLLRREIGLEGYLLPGCGAVHFDLDTPTDYLILAESGRAGPRAAAALATLPWSRAEVGALAGLIRQEGAELGLIGRVGTALMEFLNRNTALRLRVFSEERGMKALGRLAQDRVVSVLAGLIHEVGPARFFSYLSSCCHGAAFDTRVLFAHGGRRVSRRDRFYSDLGRADRIADAWVRQFTAAAVAAPIPVLRGGHSVVAGGLWVLAERCCG